MIRGLLYALLSVSVAAAAVANKGQSPVTAQGKGILPPVVKEKYEYYEVCGCCENDLQCEMKKKSIRWNDGKKYDSVTNWKVKWDYDHSRTGQSCSPDAFRVAVDVTFRLPRWVPTSKAPRPLVEKWGRYMKNLLTHEKGHRDIAVRAAEELTRNVAGLPPAGSCTELDREIQDLSREQMKMLNRDEKQYDAETDHGHTQGAVFP